MALASRELQQADGNIWSHAVVALMTRIGLNNKLLALGQQVWAVRGEAL